MQIAVAQKKEKNQKIKTQEIERLFEKLATTSAEIVILIQHVPIAIAKFANQMLKEQTRIKFQLDKR